MDSKKTAATTTGASTTDATGTRAATPIDPAVKSLSWYQKELEDCKRMLEALERRFAY
jgi:hypothetical protein